MLGGRVDYMPHNIKDTTVMYGIPPFLVGGLDYVFARYTNAQNKLVMSLNAKGVFVRNRNKSGIIEFGILNGTATGAGIQLAEMPGIPFPIIVSDSSTGGTGTCVALKCKRVGTPEWRRGASPGLDIYTFESSTLLISTGTRLPTQETR